MFRIHTRWKRKHKKQKSLDNHDSDVQDIQSPLLRKPAI